MCTVPPPPPPPPSLSSNLSPKPCDSSPTFTYSDVCKWTCFEPQLWEVCAKYSICLNEAPFQYKYKHFESILQVGPTCGLVALSMLLNGVVTAEEMLNITKTEGYSNNGEMFSCSNMANLAKKVLKLADIENNNFHVKRGGLFSEEIISELLEGAVLLVALDSGDCICSGTNYVGNNSYDADFNHSPCQRKGHTAHWALVCGIIIETDPHGSYTSNPNNVYVLCRHGKSRYLTAWTLDSLDKSNKNLIEFSPKKKDDGLTYVIPEGGIGGENGLRNQFLVFKGL